jgi:hypothetical protein
MRYHYADHVYVSFGRGCALLVTSLLAGVVEVEEDDVVSTNHTGISVPFRRTSGFVFKQDFV